QFGVTHREVDPGVLGKMLARIRRFMPAALELNAIRIWTGFRAATPDNLPYIGPVPDQPGVFAATGHEGLGITEAPGTARLIGDMILGRRSSIPPEPYLPARLHPAASR
ncbi:MAG: FAD-binding oxidoreductase, partial [Candidatus Eisenbacteria bacterium]|nr:FAD-binding oxidoreductase [Candidatus Eisenbacteria bacterium]